MKKMKRIVAITLACAMAGSILAGCGDSKKPKQASVTDDNEKIKISISLLDAEKHGKDEAFKKMCEKFNVEFDIIPVTYNDWSEKIRIWVAADDTPDIMWSDIQSYNYNEFLYWSKQGAIRAMPSLDNYPNLKKLSEKMTADDYFKVDGKLYAWPGYRNNEITNSNSLMGFYYRKDWAEKLGMAKDEYTWDEFIALSKAFIEKDPGGNGAGKTIALGSAGFAFPQVLGLMQFSPYWDSYFKKDRKYVWGPGEPETLQGIKMVKQLYDENIIWKDHVMAKTDDADNKFQANEIGILFQNWSVKKLQQVKDSFKKAHPDIDVDKAIAPFYVKSPSGKLMVLGDNDYWTITTFSKKVDDKKMNRIMKMFDWIASDEGWEYATKGVKGVDWEEKDGKVNFLGTEADKADHILKTMVRSTMPFAFEDPRLKEADKKTVLGVIDRYKKDDVARRNIDNDVYFFSAPNKDKYGSMYEQARDTIKELMVSSKDIEKDWNNWKKTVQPKVDLVLEELNKGLAK